jgi:mycobactin salicyl-AMP ligase
LPAHPAISSAAAVALPDPYLDENVCAAVIFADSPVTLADVLTKMTALPTTAVGKVDKKAIAQQLQA